MTPVLLHILSVPALLTALFTFGFAPGLVLRIIVLAFKRSDPRRQELLAELYNIPRIDRPFWVVEQVEVALSEGLIPRLVKLVKRWNLGYRLARWWRNFWHEFWHAKSADTLGSYFASLALVGSGIYLYMLLPGISRYIALVSWFALLETRAAPPSALQEASRARRRAHTYPPSRSSHLCHARPRRIRDHRIYVDTRPDNAHLGRPGTQLLDRHLYLHRNYVASLGRDPRS